ncbi:MAG TPA: hypothetical protein VE871_02180 [Longimicrobium sp.]|nr:hypothetical protein [Longimicrobium sp.]
MAAVHPRTLRAAAPALLALVLAACPGGGDGPATEGEPAPGATPGGVTTGTIPALPPGLPAPYLSGVIPTVVPPRPDSATTPEMSRPWFDVFSWQSFIALNWPAAAATRGAASNPADTAAFLNAGNAGLRVWETYKESWELFGQGNQRPTVFTDWNSPVEPCGGNLQPGQNAFTFTSKGNSLFNAAAESFSFPLVDQQGGYTLFSVRYNQPQYDTIRGADGTPNSWLYLSNNLGRSLPFFVPASDSSGTLGAIMIKSAWRPLTARDDSTRYYRTTAMVATDSTGTTCQPMLMGLVGLHIAQKQVGFPQWVWSSFEHVGNVPGPGSRAPYSYNNGLDTPQSVPGYSYIPDSLGVLVRVPNARPVQVSRINPIPTTPQGSSTQDINAIYQAYLQNTVWANYQLVITQWPSLPSQFVLVDSGGAYPAGSGSPFPMWGAVNTTMETYFQTRAGAASAGGNSCMSCHYQAGSTDYSWGLIRRAHLNTPAP